VIANFDADLRNADWTKTTWDLPTDPRWYVLKYGPSLPDYIAHLMSLPVFDACPPMLRAFFDQASNIESKGIRRVRDAEYWGMPVNTPITPGMKPVRKPKAPPLSQQDIAELGNIADIPPEVLDLLKRAQGVPGGPDHSDPNDGVPFGKRVGNCYEFAAQYELEHPSSTLVHGTVQGFGNPPLYHAWVKRHDGMVFEPTSGHWMTQDEFDWYFNAVEQEHYTHAETLDWMRKTRHYGPWQGENVGKAPLGPGYSARERHQREVDAGRVDAAREPSLPDVYYDRHERMWAVTLHDAEGDAIPDDHFGGDTVGYFPSKDEALAHAARRRAEIDTTVDESWRDVPFDADGDSDIAYYIEEPNPPAKLYHVAPRAMRERILANGLDASGQTWNTGAGGTEWYADEWLWTNGDDGEPFRFEYRPTGVYMFSTRERADEYASGWTKRGKPQDVYEIDTEANGREIIRDPSIAGNWDAYVDEEDQSYVTRYVEPSALTLIHGAEDGDQLSLDAAREPRMNVPLSNEDAAKVGLGPAWDKPFTPSVDAMREPPKGTASAAIREAVKNAEADGQPYIDAPGGGSISVEDAKDALHDLSSGRVFQYWQGDNGTGYTVALRSAAADLAGYTETSDEDVSLGNSGAYSRIIAQGLIDRADAAPVAHDLYRGIYLPYSGSTGAARWEADDVKEGQDFYAVGEVYRAPLAAFTDSRTSADFFATGQYYDINRQGVMGVVVHTPAMRAFKLEDDDEGEWIGHGEFVITSVERQTTGHGDVLYVEMVPKTEPGVSIDSWGIPWQASYMPDKPQSGWTLPGALLGLLDDPEPQYSDEKMPMARKLAMGVMPLDKMPPKGEWPEPIREQRYSGYTFADYGPFQIVFAHDRVIGRQHGDTVEVVPNNYNIEGALARFARERPEEMPIHWRGADIPVVAASEPPKVTTGMTFAMPKRQVQAADGTWYSPTWVVKKIDKYGTVWFGEDDGTRKTPYKASMDYFLEGIASGIYVPEPSVDAAHEPYPEPKRWKPQEIIDAAVAFNSDFPEAADEIRAGTPEVRIIVNDSPVGGGSRVTGTIWVGVEMPDGSWASAQDTEPFDMSRKGWMSKSGGSADLGTWLGGKYADGVAIRVYHGQMLKDRERAVVPATEAPA
jgi:hypothetical protein